MFKFAASTRCRFAAFDGGGATIQVRQVNETAVTAATRIGFVLRPACPKTLVESLALLRYFACEPIIAGQVIEIGFIEPYEGRNLDVSLTLITSIHPIQSNSLPPWPLPVAICIYTIPYSYSYTHRRSQSHTNHKHHSSLTTCRWGTVCNLAALHSLFCYCIQIQLSHLVVCDFLFFC
ncbi:hypothetical protein VNO78_07735 [Psophocarpus tetragonolobus]|uniref:Uncharacterized protein n=1 Tax=Psophocarpus tetragonolobus TaxID=3891 RepID=A0AAN9XSC3_PSOTE